MYKIKMDKVLTIVPAKQEVTPYMDKVTTEKKQPKNLLRKRYRQSSSRESTGSPQRQPKLFVSIKLILSYNPEHKNKSWRCWVYG